ncbi:MAG: hypothetical protein ACPGOV_02205 [Magnetovibrionaceae bacterium]
MILFFFAGVALLVAAFIGAAAEAVAPLAPGTRSMINPAIDVWSALWPVSQLAFRDSVGEAAWGALAQSLLQLPFWILFGLPGFFLVYRFRPQGFGRNVDEGPEEDDLFLFDRLAAQARAEGYHDDDDMHPSKETGEAPPEDFDFHPEIHQLNHDDMAPGASHSDRDDEDLGDDGTDDMAPSNTDEYVPPDDIDWSEIELEYPLPDRDRDQDQKS